MILQSLVDYYEYLVETDDKIAKPGWCSRNVSFIFDLSPEGRLIAVIPTGDKPGKSMVVPEQGKNTSGISPNFLCGNSSYFIGIDNKEKPERAKECFLAAKTLHLDILGMSDSSPAKEVKLFFTRWNPNDAALHEALKPILNDVLKGGNIVFCVNGTFAQNDDVIQEVWLKKRNAILEGTTLQTCLITGRKEPIARLHPAQKGIMGAQTMGISLVSFNERSFTSYGHDKDQGLNAPVGEYATFAYTTALNYLLANKNHRIYLGDTTIVFWADKTDEACVNLLDQILNPDWNNEDGQQDGDQFVHDILEKVSQGKFPENVDSDANFFILGLTHNAARTVVRFFLRDTFGTVLDNIRQHYERLNIDKASYEKKYFSPFRLLMELENVNSKNKVVSSMLAGALMRSILGNTAYPDALYSNVLLRIRATRDNKDKGTKKITSVRAAIIKAYQQKNYRKDKEVVTVSLNEMRQDVPYLLGRMFSVFEDIQTRANPNLNTTIKDKYFDTSGTNPALVFPVLSRLSESHLKKVKRENPGLAIYYSKLLMELYDFIDKIPSTLSAEEQGDYILGYYHQTQNRYKKKTIDQEGNK